MTSISITSIFLITELGKSFKACVISGRYVRDYVWRTVRYDTWSVLSNLSVRIMIDIDIVTQMAIFLPFFILNDLQ